MATKVEVTRNGKKYSYDYERIVVLLGIEEVEVLRRYADKFHPKLNGKGNINHSVRHILETVFSIAENPEVQRMIKSEPHLNDDICMGLRRLVDLAIKANDTELEDESYALY